MFVYKSSLFFFSVFCLCDKQVADIYVELNKMESEVVKEFLKDISVVYSFNIIGFSSSFYWI